MVMVMVMVVVMMMIMLMTMTVTVSVTITLGPGTVVSTSGPTSVFSRRCHPKDTPLSYSLLCHPDLNTLRSGTVVLSVHAVQAYGGVWVQLYAFLALNDGERSVSQPGRLTPGEGISVIND